MKEPKWWEEELPSPEELMPLSQTLITPDLASAFNIRSPTLTPSTYFNSSPHLLRLQNHHIHHRATPPPPHPQPDFDSSSAELGGGGGSAGGGAGSGGEEPARTLKRPRLVWTPQLHKRFVDAVAHLGIKNAVPKTIMQLMSVDGLTRENVASHLQKYRLYLKRMQGLNSGGGGGGGGGGGSTGSGPGGLVGSGDPATDHLFASSPVPPHFLHQGGGCGVGANGGRANSEHFLPYVNPAVAVLQHHQQIAAVAGPHPGIQAQYHHHHRHVGHFGSPQNGGGGGAQFEHPFLTRQAHQIGGRMVQHSGGGYTEDLESGAVANVRKVLTLFPTGDD